MKDRCAVGDALGCAKGPEAGGANELGALGEEANEFVVTWEWMPPVKVGVELNYREDDMKARNEAHTVGANPQAKLTRGPVAMGNTWRSIGKAWMHPMWEENTQRQW